MPTVVVTITNNRFPELARKLPIATQGICMDTARAIETAVKVGMAAGKSGAWYGSHQASAPGEMPAIDTGALAGSIVSEPEGSGAVVAAGMEYAVHLEYGTINMAPRPFFGPAATAERPRFIQAMADLERHL